MIFPPLGNSDHITVSLSIKFKTGCSISSHSYDYSLADWDGLCDHLTVVPWEDIFKLGASAAASEFCE